MPEGQFLRSCLLILVFAVFVHGKTSQQTASTNPCSTIDIKASVKHTSTGLRNGHVSITASGGAAPYYFVFYKEGGYPFRHDPASSEISELSKGVIYCNVVDQNGCTDKIKITIE
jgi:hypothetical protein